MIPASTYTVYIGLKIQHLMEKPKQIFGSTQYLYKFIGSIERARLQGSVDPEEAKIGESPSR